MDPARRLRPPGSLVRGSLAALLVLLLAGCGGEDEPPVAPTTPEASPTPTAAETTPAPTPVSTPTPTATAPFFANTEEDTGEPAGPAQVAVTEVRVSTHRGFDRITFTIRGNGKAGWRAGYIEDPRSQGTGDPVEVVGAAVLEVVITNTGHPPDVDFEPIGEDPGLPSGLGSVQDVVNDTLFEGQHLFFVGVDGRRAFRVRRVDDPQRVVLEVLH